MLLSSAYPKISSDPFKGFLVLVAIIFAVVATLLLIFFTTAATDTGRNPALAITLVPGENSGILGPNQPRWYRFIPQIQNPTLNLEQSLTLIFSPIHPHITPHIALQIFETAQIIRQDDLDQLTGFGQGQLADRDGDPATGELYWQGDLSPEKVYYVQLRNDSDSPIDYTIFIEAIDTGMTTGETEAADLAEPGDAAKLKDLAASDGAAPPDVTPADDRVALPEMGREPGVALSLSPGAQRGQLNPGTSHWYTFSSVDLTQRARQFQDLNFNLFFTPDDGNRRHQVNFQLFSVSEVEAWQRGERARPNNFGAGMLVSRDGDPNTGERIWRGVILKDTTYFLAIESNADVAIDYWLFDQDIPNPELGSQPASNPVPTPGVAPQTATPLNLDRNRGKLEPGQESWYSFSIADNDADYFEEAALTMVMTPADNNRIQQVTFEIFTVDSVRNWSPDNRDGFSNVGAGSVVYRDENPWTGERFWSGWVVDNDLYYVRIVNGAATPIDYWLFVGDVYQPSLD
jgi:hypothetical protein